MSFGYLKPLNKPAISDITNNIKKIKNKTFAIEAAPAAMPPNPNIAAIKATIKNITTHLNIMIPQRM